LLLLLLLFDVVIVNIDFIWICRVVVIVHWFTSQGNIVLTVAEAKGLEFEDVLVYNFFSDSPLSTEWRVIHSYTKNSEYAAHALDTQPTTLAKMKAHVPNHLRELQFDASKHQLLCSELKKLYMIITRAKSKLFFFDNSYENRASVEALWQKRDAYTSDLMQSGISIKTSTCEEWKETGLMFFQRERFTQAAHCFHHECLSFIRGE
jgi:hypothetical protein